MKRFFIKFIPIFLILVIYVGHFFLSQARFVKNVEVANVNLNITGVKYWKNIEATGFTDNTYKEIINTKEVLTLQTMGKSRSCRKNKNTNIWFARGIVSIMF